MTSSGPDVTDLHVEMTGLVPPAVVVEEDMATAGMMTKGVVDSVNVGVVMVAAIENSDEMVAAIEISREAAAAANGVEVPEEIWAEVHLPEMEKTTVGEQTNQWNLADLQGKRACA